LLLWAHLSGAIAWLGAIIFVHVIQTPKVAGRGVPRGYLVLAWSSIGTIGVSGVVLTLADIEDLGVLTGNRWGVLLLVKVGLYLVLAGIALAVTLVISPRLRHLADFPALRQRLHEPFANQGLTTVGYGDKIYDVTASRLWKNGLHAGRHAAWHDLTGELAGAPHSDEVLKRFPVLTARPTVPPQVVRLFVGLAYLNLGLVLALLLTVALWLTA